MNSDDLSGERGRSQASWLAASTLWGARARVSFGNLAAIREGVGDTVLLLHGVGLCAEAWAAQIDAISHEYTVLAPDLPGHGESGCLDADDQLSDVTDRIAAAMQAPAFVVGHSMGAMVALDLAIRYPGKVRGVIALNAIFQRDAAAKAAVQARAKALNDANNPDPEPTLQRWFGDSNSDEKSACLDWLTAVHPTGYRAAYRIFATEDGPCDAALSVLACPALFMTGSAEPNSTPDMARAMATLTPNGRALIVEGAAHMMPMTHADAVNRALLSFFRDVSR